LREFEDIDINQILTMKKSRDISLDLCLIAITLITRIPFVSKYLWDWDSVLLVKALEKFYIPAHSPHPPGYIFTVWAGEFFNVFLNGNNSYIAFSILCTALTAILIRRIARRFLDKDISFWVGIFWLTAPLVWFWGEVASSYMTAPVFVAALVFSAMKLDESDKKYIWIAVMGAIVGIASGFRQDLGLFLGVPVLIVIAANHRYGLLKLIMFCFLGFIVPFSLWFFISAANCGGVGEYLSLVNSQFGVSIQGGRFQRLMFRIKLGSRRVLVGLLLSFGTILVLGLINIFISGNSKNEKEKQLYSNLRLISWALILFPILFYVFVFINKMAYMLLVFPPAMLLFFKWIEAKYDSRRLLISLILAFSILNGIAFLAMPPRHYSRYFYKPADFAQIYDRTVGCTNLKSISDFEKKMDFITGPIGGKNSPDRTFIVLPYPMGYFTLRHAQYYMDNYPIICFYHPGYHLYYGFKKLDDRETQTVGIPNKYDRLLIIGGAVEPDSIQDGRIITAERVTDVDLVTVEIEKRIRFAGYEFVRVKQD